MVGIDYRPMLNRYKDLPARVGWADVDVLRYNYLEALNKREFWRDEVKRLRGRLERIRNKCLREAQK